MGPQIWEEIYERKKSQDRRKPERKKPGAGMAKAPEAHPEGQSSRSDTQKDQKNSSPSFPTTHGKTLDGLVKSPSAALRFNFVVAAHLEVRLTPQFLRALHLELFTKPSFC
jgi:hypothetical protein